MEYDTGCWQRTGLA